ncbi:unnamed protein product [Camellia sinensis]
MSLSIYGTLVSIFFVPTTSSSSSSASSAAAMSSSALLHRPQRRRISSPSTTTTPTTLTSAERVINNDDLLKQILIRLPAKPLFAFKRVSKRWLSLISDRYVLRDWLPPISPSSFFLRRYSTPSSHSISFNHISLLPSNSTRSFDFVNDPNGVKISQSCNGLFLCSSSCFTLDYSDTRYYVLNPTTKYFSTIPRPTNGDDRNFLVSMNLAFDPSVSFHYKVVAVRSKRWRGPDFQIAIYSSQTQTWTFSEVSYAYSTLIVFENGVFLNGKIHWPTCHSLRSIYYDVNQDKLLPFRMPHCDLTKDLLYFAESGGCLQLIEFTKNCSRHFHVFELETDYSKWFVRYHIDLKLAVPDFPEMYREQAGWPSRGYTFNVLCFLAGDLEGDSCLVLYVPGKVISYNFKDETFRKICDLNLSLGDIDYVRVRPWFTVHPCIETIFRV